MRSLYNEISILSYKNFDNSPNVVIVYILYLIIMNNDK